MSFHFFLLLSLAEALDMQPPVMPEDGHTRVTTGEESPFSATGKETSALEPLWDDEDTRAFYEFLPDLRFVLKLNMKANYWSYSLGQPHSTTSHLRSWCQSHYDVTLNLVLRFLVLIQLFILLIAGFDTFGLFRLLFILINWTCIVIGYGPPRQPLLLCGFKL